MRKLWLGLFVGGVALLSCNNPTGSGVCGNGDFVIIKAADNKTFTPQHATATQSQSICFENTGSIVHSVVADSFVANDSTWKKNGEQGLAPGFPVIVKVGVGDYYYHCGIHGFAGDTTQGMWGKITIR